MWKHYSKAGWAGGAVWAHCLANWKVQMRVQTPRSPLGLGERQPDIISEGSARADGAGAGAPPAMAREVAWRRFLALPRSLVPSGLKRRKKRPKCENPTEALVPSKALVQYILERALFPRKVGVCHKYYITNAATERETCQLHNLLASVHIAMTIF